MVLRQSPTSLGSPLQRQKHGAAGQGTNSQSYPYKQENPLLFIARRIPPFELSLIQIAIRRSLATPAPRFSQNTIKVDRLTTSSFMVTRPPLMPNTHLSSYGCGKICRTSHGWRPLCLTSQLMTSPWVRPSPSRLRFFTWAPRRYECQLYPKFHNSAPAVNASLTKGPRNTRNRLYKVLGQGNEYRRSYNPDVTVRLC